MEVPKCCLPVSSYNLRPPVGKIISELTAQCERAVGQDGNRTMPTRIWVLRRALEYLVELTENTGSSGPVD